MITMDFISSFRKPFQSFKQRNGMIWFPREVDYRKTDKETVAVQRRENPGEGGQGLLHKGIMS